MGGLHDHEAERAVLGAVLADKRRFSEVAEIIGTPDNFAAEVHALLWEALLEADEDGFAFDPITVADILKRRGTLDRVGGLGYLVGLDTAAPTSANALEYARLVMQASQRRKIHALGRKLASDAEAGASTPAELAAQAEGGLSDAVGDAKGGGLQAMPVVMEGALNLLDKLRTSIGGVTGLASGHMDLDRMTTGFHPGELIVVAARPGVGKTALVLNWLSYMSTVLKQSGAMFSLEMPTEQLALRLLAAEAGVSLKRLREGGLSDHDMGKINEAASKLYGAPMWIDDTASMGLFGIRTRMKAHRQRSKTPLAVVAIDYLQLMGGGDPRNREQEVASYSRGLKQLAKDERVVVIALSQLNRKVDDRKDGRPRLSDLRESGSLEQDADAVMFIHEVPEEDEEQVPGAKQVELIVAKQRNGPTGSVFLHLLPDIVKFVSRARGYA